MPPSILSSPLFKKIETIKGVLNGIRAGVAYLEARGLQRDQVMDLLGRAESDGRDLTDAEVAEAIGAAQESIDRLRQAAGGNEETETPESEESGEN